MPFVHGDFKFGYEVRDSTDLCKSLAIYEPAQVQATVASCLFLTPWIKANKVVLSRAGWMINERSAFLF